MILDIEKEQYEFQVALNKEFPATEGYTLKGTSAIFNTAWRMWLAAKRSVVEQQACRHDEGAREDSAVIHKLATILAGVCVALKGDALPLHRHSYHDIVEVATALKLELDLYRAQAEISQQSSGANVSERVCDGPT